MGSLAGSRRDTRLRFLLLEDSDLDAELIREMLGPAGLDCAIERVIAHEDFLRAIDCSEWDLILADYVLPSFDGLRALTLARKHCPSTPFIFVSGMLGEEIAVEALKRGATDYVLKQRLERLPLAVARALSEARERAERRKAQDALEQLLAERTSLLHELDHRVKNNLQLLLSLVNMEIRRSRAPEARRALARVKERLQALGAAHRELHDGQRSGLFNVSDFARSLCEELIASADRPDLRAVYNLHAMRVPTTQAAPMALLLNEIVSSAVTHAYADRRGTMHVEIARRGDRHCFEIADEEFTRDEKRAARDGTSGLILEGLAQQLNAVVNWPDDEPRVLVRMTLPVQDGIGAR
jgi:two-component sensor histidine kinase